MEIDLESARLEIVARLPLQLRLSIKGDPWDFDFSKSRALLQPLSPADLGCGNIEEQWKPLHLFGATDYCEGGGASSYLGIHRDTGEVFDLDVERSGARMKLLNSNIDRFIRSILNIRGILRARTLHRGKLAATLKKIDPPAFHRSAWQDFGDHMEHEEQCEPIPPHPSGASPPTTTSPHTSTTTSTIPRFPVK